MGLLDLFEKLLRERHVLLGAAHRERARRRIQLRPRDAGHLANHPHRFVHLVRGHRGREQDFFFHFERVLPFLLRRVFGDKHRMGVHNARERLGLARKNHHGRVEVQRRNLELDRAIGQIAVKHHLHAELLADFLVRASRRAAIVEGMCSGVENQAGQTGETRAFFQFNLSGNWRQFRQALAGHDVVRVYLQRLGQQRARPRSVSGNGLAFRAIDERLNDLKPGVLPQHGIFPVGRIVRGRFGVGGELRFPVAGLFRAAPRLVGVFGAALIRLGRGRGSRLGPCGRGNRR